MSTREANPTEALRATDPLFAKLSPFVAAAEWPQMLEHIAEIKRLKEERNAVILAHNYQRPEIFHTIADITGDSLALARKALHTTAEVIVMCGVHFMAETAKLTCPEKRVLIPDPEAGCSLASSITAADVAALRAQHPGVPVVTYVNSSAEVKAASDICCTSGNAVKIVRSLGVPRVIFLPDAYLGAYVQQETGIELILWQGHCEVHEKFTAADIAKVRTQHPDVFVLAHPECALDVLEAADFVGSTAVMADYVEKHRPPTVFFVTECSLIDNIAVVTPEVNFIRPCHLCPHMQRITLANVAAALRHMQTEVHIAPEVAGPARAAIDAMLAVP